MTGVKWGLFFPSQLAITDANACHFIIAGEFIGKNDHRDRKEDDTEKSECEPEKGLIKEVHRYIIPRWLFWSR